MQIPEVILGDISRWITGEISEEVPGEIAGGIFG